MRSLRSEVRSKFDELTQKIEPVSTVHGESVARLDDFPVRALKTLQNDIREMKHDLKTFQTSFCSRDANNIQDQDANNANTIQDQDANNIQETQIDEDDFAQELEDTVLLRSDENNSSELQIGTQASISQASEPVVPTAQPVRVKNQKILKKRGKKPTVAKDRTSDGSGKTHANNSRLPAHSRTTSTLLENFNSPASNSAPLISYQDMCNRLESAGKMPMIKKEKYMSKLYQLYDAMQKCGGYGTVARTRQRSRIFQQQGIPKGSITRWKLLYEATIEHVAPSSYQQQPKRKKPHATEGHTAGITKRHRTLHNIRDATTALADTTFNRDTLSSLAIVRELVRSSCIVATAHHQSFNHEYKLGPECLALLEQWTHADITSACVHLGAQTGAEILFAAISAIITEEIEREKSSRGSTSSMTKKSPRTKTTVGDVVLAKYTESSKSWKRATVTSVTRGQNQLSVKFDGYEDASKIPSSRLHFPSYRDVEQSQMGRRIYCLILLAHAVTGAAESVQGATSTVPSCSELAAYLLRKLAHFLQQLVTANCFCPEETANTQQSTELQLAETFTGAGLGYAFALLVQLRGDLKYGRSIVLKILTLMLTVQQHENTAASCVRRALRPSVLPMLDAIGAGWFSLVPACMDAGRHSGFAKSAAAYEVPQEASGWLARTMRVALSEALSQIDDAYCDEIQLLALARLKRIWKPARADIELGPCFENELIDAAVRSDTDTAVLPHELEKDLLGCQPCSSMRAVELLARARGWEWAYQTWIIPVLWPLLSDRTTCSLHQVAAVKMLGILGELVAQKDGLPATDKAAADAEGADTDRIISASTRERERIAILGSIKEGLATRLSQETQHDTVMVPAVLHALAQLG